MVDIDEDMLFADNVRRLREEQGMSRADLVRRLREEGWDSVHQTTITRIENREQRVRLRDANLIAKVLNSSVTNMLQPDFDSELAERLYKIREQLQIRRQDIHLGADRWLDAEASAKHALADADAAGVAPTERVAYDGVDRVPRATAEDEYRFILRELGEPPERTVKLVRERRDRTGYSGDSTT